VTITFSGLRSRWTMPACVSGGQTSAILYREVEDFANREGRARGERAQ